MYYRDGVGKSLGPRNGLSCSLVPEAFDLAVSRSKHRPLRIVVERSDASPKSNAEWSLMGRHISANLSHAEMLSLQVLRGSVDDWSILGGKPVPLPQLRLLVISVWTMNPLKVDLSLAPLLEELWISAFPNGIALSHAPSVKKLGLVKAKSPATSVQSIKACPNLETLIWDYAAAIPSPDGTSPFTEISLPKLKHFRLGIKFEFVDQLRLLNAPSLERLCLQVLDGGAITLDFQSRFPSLRELAIVTQPNTSIILSPEFLQSHPHIRIIELYGGKVVPWWTAAPSGPFLLPRLERLRASFANPRNADSLLEYYAGHGEPFVLEQGEKLVYDALKPKFGDRVTYNSGERFINDYWKDWMDNSDAWV